MLLGFGPYSANYKCDFKYVNFRLLPGQKGAHLDIATP